MQVSQQQSNNSDSSYTTAKTRLTFHFHFAIPFRCTNGDFYVALGSSRGLALFVWVGGGLLKRVLYFFGNEPSLGQKISDPAPASLQLFVVYTLGISSS